MTFKISIFFAWATLFSQWAIAQPIQKSAPAPLKPRVVVLTDVSTWETDDSESLVRLLVHADMLEIEGLVYTTGWSLDSTRAEFFNLIQDATDAYRKDLPNLRKRSNQKFEKVDESRQQVGYWPSANYLKMRTVYGSKNRGIAFIGEGNDSRGSNLIIKLVDEKDDRRVWVLGWGGGNTLAQAIWRVRKERSEKELQKFLKKLRFYAITDQDRDQRTPFDISSHQWMRREFGKQLFFIWDESAWSYQNGTGKRLWEQYETQIQNHGNLGKVYPKYKYGVEGDTPSFLYLLPNGINSPENPGFGSWGGYFEFGTTEDNKTSSYTNHGGSKANATSRKYEDYFYQATFNNFAARMDWAHYGAGNRNPVVIINGEKGVEPIKLTAKPGDFVTLDASGSFDPDGNNLNYRWWVLYEAGSYKEHFSLDNTHGSLIRVQVPPGALGKSFHIICEVTDNGKHNLAGYRRIIIRSVSNL